MLEKIKNYYINHKKAIVLVTLLIVLIISWMIGLIIKNATPESVSYPTTSPSPIVSSQINQTNNYFSNNPNDSYFINQIVTNKIPVTGYSWSNNKLIYSTPTGIYEAGTNAIIINKNIQKIVWANNFVAIFKSEGVWFRLDYQNKSAIELNLNLVSPSINSSGSIIADFSKNTAFLYNLTGGNNVEKAFSENVDSILFPVENTNVVVATKFGNSTYLYNLDENLNQTEKITLDKPYNLSSVSNDGRIFTATLGNELLVSDFSKTLYKDVFITNSKIYTAFRSNSEIIEIESYKDSLGRVLENIYLADIQGKRTRISDSRPIINRLNTVIPTRLNFAQNVAAFAENNGKIWILSLKTNLFPTYSDTGDLVFSNIKPSSH